MELTDVNGECGRHATGNHFVVESWERGCRVVNYPDKWLLLMSRVVVGLNPTGAYDVCRKRVI